MVACRRAFSSRVVANHRWHEGCRQISLVTAGRALGLHNNDLHTNVCHCLYCEQQ